HQASGHLARQRATASSGKAVGSESTGTTVGTTGSSGTGLSGSTAGIGVTRYDSGHWGHQASGHLGLASGQTAFIWQGSGHLRHGHQALDRLARQRHRVTRLE
ncbi:unnamed protein product, partial [Staurois parvus]